MIFLLAWKQVTEVHMPLYKAWQRAPRHTGLGNLPLTMIRNDAESTRMVDSRDMTCKHHPFDVALQ